MRVDRYRDGDIDEVELDGLHGLAQIEASVECFTFTEGDEVVSIAGFVEISQGVFSLWAYQTPGVHRVSYAKRSKRLLDAFFKEYHPRHVYIGIATACDERWARFLGFEYEYTMKDFYEDGRDLKGYVCHG